MLIWGLGRGDYFVVFPPVAMVDFRGSGIGVGDLELASRRSVCEASAGIALGLKAWARG